jgi:hypothetical protein
MAQTAQLRANHFVRSSLDRREPDRNQRTGDCVATDPHAWQKEIVDHVLRGKFSNDWPIHRNMKFSSRYDIVFAGGIVRIEAERV